jgi:hypothetical protein
VEKDEDWKGIDLRFDEPNEEEMLMDIGEYFDKEMLFEPRHQKHSVSSKNNPSPFLKNK